MLYLKFFQPLAFLTFQKFLCTLVLYLLYHLLMLPVSSFVYLYVHSLYRTLYYQLLLLYFQKNSLFLGLLYLLYLQHSLISKPLHRYLLLLILFSSYYLLILRLFELVLFLLLLTVYSFHRQTFGYFYHLLAN